jgi:hypothetical protein
LRREKSWRFGHDPIAVAVVIRDCTRHVPNARHHAELLRQRVIVDAGITEVVGGRVRFVTDERAAALRPVLATMVLMPAVVAAMFIVGELSSRKWKLMSGAAGAVGALPVISQPARRGTLGSQLIDTAL